jgi:protein-S-isoprenylcysteine O-methyltransferase Ste14
MKTEHQISVNPSCMSKVCKPSFGVVALSGLLGGVSMILFVVFLYTGLPSRMDLGFSDQTTLYFNTLLCFLFFLQHSLMVRNGFHNWLTGFIQKKYHGAFYSIFSGICLLILMLFWQRSASFQIELDGAAYFFIRALFFLSLIGFYITARSLGLFDPLGIREIILHAKGKTQRPPVLIVRGTYRWVRHPLYFFSLLMIWSQVSVTPDRLLFNGLWTVWIIIGAMLEERDLVASFGDAYRTYQRHVPMLIPYKWRPWNHNKNQ